MQSYWRRGPVSCGNCFFLCLVFTLLLTGTSMAQTAHTFEVKGGQFLYDNKPVQIHSGEMHYARIPAPYWRHRLKMMKAMGLNTVATYVFWNFHNPAPGVWDFSTDSHNLAEFLRIAREENLFVILRPGPYACAEWEFGGYPWDNFELLWQWSPLRYVRQVQTPVMFIHGEQDNDVHIAQAEEMYMALKRRGVETVFVRYPREGHSLREPKHRIDALERTIAWFDRFMR
jgi:acetyl esterase/lipase